MSDLMYEPDEDDDNEVQGLDTEYVYPNAKRLIEIANSMNHYDTKYGIETQQTLSIKDDNNLPEKYLLAEVLCNEFANIERTADDNPGLIMMLYEGMIFKHLWDLRLQTISVKRYKELARFWAVGCAVMTGVVIYLLA